MTIIGKVTILHDILSQLVFFTTKSVKYIGFCLKQEDLTGPIAVSYTLQSQLTLILVSTFWGEFRTFSSSFASNEFKFWFSDCLPISSILQDLNV